LIVLSVNAIKTGKEAVTLYNDKKNPTKPSRPVLDAFDIYSNNNNNSSSYNNKNTQRRP